MDDLRKLQLKEVEMLRETISFFDKHNLRYFAISGTLLGAVRHKGFIPWDDDIDLGMPRADYDKLLKISRHNKEISLRSFLNDKNYCQYFAKIESDRIRVIIKKPDGSEEKTSSWISVFPFDGMPNNRIVRKLFMFRILFRRMLYVIARFDELVNREKANRPFSERAIMSVTKKLHLQKMFSKKSTYIGIDKLLKKYPYDSSNYVVDAMGAYKFKEMYPRKWFGKGKEYDFEGIKINGPDEYHLMLKQLYGDYMTPVGEKERKGHSISEVTFL